MKQPPWPHYSARRYPSHTQYLVLTQAKLLAMVLRLRDAISSTDLGHAATRQETEMAFT